MILFQDLPVPLDNPGADQIGVFKTIRHITGASGQIALFRDNHWTAGEA